MDVTILNLQRTYPNSVIPSEAEEPFGKLRAGSAFCRQFRRRRRTAGSSTARMIRVANHSASLGMTDIFG
jgi:hypothetical protein